MTVKELLNAVNNDSYVRIEIIYRKPTSRSQSVCYSPLHPDEVADSCPDEIMDAHVMEIQPTCQHCELILDVVAVMEVLA